MKRLRLSLFLCCLILVLGSVWANAQHKYCRVSLPIHSLSSRLHAVGDFGDLKAGDSLYKYVPPLEKVEFKGSVDLLNYMSGYHWELVMEYTDSKVTPADYYFYFRLDLPK